MEVANAASERRIDETSSLLHQDSLAERGMFCASPYAAILIPACELSCSDTDSQHLSFLIIF